MKSMLENLFNPFRHLTKTLKWAEARIEEESIKDKPSQFKKAYIDGIIMALESTKVAYNQGFTRFSKTVRNFSERVERLRQEYPKRVA